MFVLLMNDAVTPNVFFFAVLYIVVVVVVDGTNTVGTLGDIILNTRVPV